MSSGFKVQGSGFGLQGLGFRVSGFKGDFTLGATPSTVMITSSWGWGGGVRYTYQSGSNISFSCTQESTTRATANGP